MAISLIIWALVFIMIFTILLPQGQRAVKMYDIPYSDFYNPVEAGNVKYVTIAGKEIRGETINPIDAQGIKFNNFKTLMPFEDAGLIKELVEKKVVVEGRSFFNVWRQVVPYLILPLFLIIFWVFMIRQAGRVPAEAMRFGQSRARRVTETEKTTFNDVAGVDEAKEELKEVVEFLRIPQNLNDSEQRYQKVYYWLALPEQVKPYSHERQLAKLKSHSLPYQAKIL